MFVHRERLAHSIPNETHPERTAGATDDVPGGAKRLLWTSSTAGSRAGECQSADTVGVEHLAEQIGKAVAGQGGAPEGDLEGHVRVGR